MVEIQDVRSELQLPESVITDEDVQYAIDKIDMNDINLVCAEVLTMFLRGNRGKIKFKLKNYEEWFEPSEIRMQIRNYQARSTNATFDDGIEYPDTAFPEETTDDSTC